MPKLTEISARSVSEIYLSKSPNNDRNLNIKGSHVLLPKLKKLYSNLKVKRNKSKS